MNCNYHAESHQQLFSPHISSQTKTKANTRHKTEQELNMTKPPCGDMSETELHS